MISKLEWCLTRKDTEEVVTVELLGGVREEVQKFKAIVGETFDARCITSLCTLKFHLLDHFLKDLNQFMTLELLSSSVFERFNVHIKQAYRSTSQRRGSVLQEILKVMDPSREEKREGLVASRKEKPLSIAEKRDRICCTGSLLVPYERKTMLRCMESAIRKKEVVRINGRVAMAPVRLLEKDSMGTFAGLLKFSGRMLGEAGG